MIFSRVQIAWWGPCTVRGQIVEDREHSERGWKGQGRRKTRRLGGRKLLPQIGNTSAPGSDTCVQRGGRALKGRSECKAEST